MNCLNKGESLPVCSPLTNLTPVLDEKGFIRVGGRLDNAHLSFSARHPLILHQKCHLGHLLLRDSHLNLLHAGPQQMASHVSSTYHIIACRKQARSIYRNCISCRKRKAQPLTQRMGQLPSNRVNPGHPFAHTGTDFAGPVYIKQGAIRKPVMVKCYICVFVSFTVKAIHLELVSDLSTSAFIAALRRFIARRGKPSTIHSDHGSNFVGADREINEMTTFMRTQETKDAVIDFCSTKGIEWVFTPQKAPHHGGLWESAVKAVKRHLLPIVQDSKFNFEEYYTILTQVEAVINSRPICPVSPDDAGVAALTPGHFLIGQPLEALSDYNYQEMKNPRRWNLVQKMVQTFWIRWQKEYLITLNKTNKWKRENRNVQENDLVLIRNDNPLATGRWPLARVVKVLPGKDGLVRVVDVKTTKGIYRRPVQKLVMLLEAEDTPAARLPGGSMDTPPSGEPSKG